MANAADANNMEVFPSDTDMLVCKASMFGGLARRGEVRAEVESLFLEMFALFEVFCGLGPLRLRLLRAY